MFVLVGVRESNVLGFTGMGRVLMSFTHALLLLLPLLALTATGQLINRARDDGTLEMLFSHRCRAALFSWHHAGALRAAPRPVDHARAAARRARQPVLRQAIPWAFLGRALAISAALLWAFGAGAAHLDGGAQSGARHDVRAGGFRLGVALLDFGVIGFAQVAAARRDIVRHLRGKPGAGGRAWRCSRRRAGARHAGACRLLPSSRIGENALFALGTLWPVALAHLWWAASRHFRKSDLV